jgi:hypothetical protein
MSNYPNMSYCMYENTLAAMQQIINNLNDAHDDGTLLEDYRDSLGSLQEADAFDSIRGMCKRLAAALENMNHHE